MFEGIRKIEELADFRRLEVLIPRGQPESGFFSMTNSTIAAEVDFSRSIFPVPVLLGGSKFGNYIDFGHSIFGRVPRVVGTSFDEGIGFESAKFGMGDEAAYRKIKKIMEDKGTHWEAAIFFSYELEEQLWRMTPLQRLFSPSLWYSLINEFGRSLSRPLWIVFFSAVAFGGVYAALDGIEPVVERDKIPNWVQTVSDGGPLLKGMIFSFQKLTLAWLVDKSALVPKTPGLWFLSTLQSTLTLLLEAMFILGLRRRFRVQS
jgi:hypothetical protein